MVHSAGILVRYYTGPVATALVQQLLYIQINHVTRHMHAHYSYNVKSVDLHVEGRKKRVALTDFNYMYRLWFAFITLILLIMTIVVFNLFN